MELPSIHDIAAVSGVLLSLGLGLSAIWSVCHKHPLTGYQEKRLTVLKAWRIFGFCLLAFSQAAVVLLEIWNTPAHGVLPVSAADADQKLALVLWCTIIVILSVTFRRQASLAMFPTHVLSLLLSSALLVVDIFECEQYPTNVSIASISTHTAQLAVVASLLVIDITMLHGVIASASGTEAGVGEPLLGKDGDKDDQSPPREATRMSMAMSAFRYVWPDNPNLQTRLWACFALVVMERVVNLMVPILYKNMVNQMSSISTGLSLARRWAATLSAAHGGGGTEELGRELMTLLTGMVQGAQHVSFWTAFYPWVFAYLAFFFLRGGSGVEGLLANVRDLLFIPITQSAYRRISLDVFDHLLDLDHNYHLHRKTGQIMRILDRGTSSIQDTVTIVLFNVVPQMFDIVAACVYLAIYTQPWTAVIVFVTVASYVPLTICITERRGRIRKMMNALDNAREGRATDMLLNYETVKYFCNERFELSKFNDATRLYQAAEYWQMAFLCVLSIVQSLVVWVGLASGLVVCTQGLADGSLLVGDAVLFITMMTQLYVPLTYFGSYYRQVQKALIDMENMFTLLQTVPKVQDMPGAGKLKVVAGKLAFSNVTFGYSISHPVLRGVSFIVPGGKTMAVVGATGSGKSTLLRLLLRFYDPQSGAVLIDDQNIALMKQKSVRRAIAVVPQDTVLFNDTVMYNIRYGRPDATDAEVFEAAEVAHIHQSITRAFNNGYDTRVGERGLRLSGGEKQRVAFARAVLKRPAILVLDEATSALDSLTEQQIQSSLVAMRTRCTTVIIAHRLSTIVDADFILVLDHGVVSQFGSHAELIEQDGLYSAMWSRQQTDVDGSLFQASQRQSRNDLQGMYDVAVAKAAAAAAAKGGAGGGDNGVPGGRPGGAGVEGPGDGLPAGASASKSTIGTSRFTGSRNGHPEAASDGHHHHFLTSGLVTEEPSYESRCSTPRNSGTPQRLRPPHAHGSAGKKCDSPPHDDDDDAGSNGGGGGADGHHREGGDVDPTILQSMQRRMAADLAIAVEERMGLSPRRDDSPSAGSPSGGPFGNAAVLAGQAVGGPAGQVGQAVGGPTGHVRRPAAGSREDVATVPGRAIRGPGSGGQGGGAGAGAGRERGQPSPRGPDAV